MLKSEIDDLTLSDKENLDNIAYYTNILEDYRTISINNHITLDDKKLKDLEDLEDLDRRDVNTIVMNMSKLSMNFRRFYEYLLHTWQITKIRKSYNINKRYL
jgi:hypothetical protein